MTSPQPQPLKLNLGCADVRLAGFVGVDLYPGPAVDRVANLNYVPWPFADFSADFILAHDIIEHLIDKQVTMCEIYRVLKPGGQVEICVPSTDGPGAFQDPTHVSFWNRRSFLYYEKGNIYRERFKNSYLDRLGRELPGFIVREDKTIRTVDGPKVWIVLEKPMDG